MCKYLRTWQLTKWPAAPKVGDLVFPCESLDIIDEIKASEMLVAPWISEYFLKFKNLEIRKFGKFGKFWNIWKILEHLEKFRTFGKFGKVLKIWNFLEN